MGRRIFIYHDGALGDLLLSIPTMEVFRESGDSIFLAGRGDVVDFLKRLGYISDGMRSGSQVFLPLFSGFLDDALRAFLSGFDGIYVFCAEVTSAVASGIRSVFPAARVIRTIPPPDSRLHVADFRRNQVCLESRGEGRSVRLQIPSAYLEEARDMLSAAGYDFRRPLVAVHPGSGGREKCWPLIRFLDLMKRLTETHKCFITIFSGPAESGTMDKELADYTKRHQDTCSYVTGHDLMTVASLLRLSHLYVGNDSGITHLASCVMYGRIIALFGPTDVGLWGPRSGGATIVASDMECAPCENRAKGEHRRKHYECGIKCLSDISVSRVMKSLEFPVA